MAVTATINFSEQTRQTLGDLAKANGTTIGDTVTRWAEKAHRDQLCAEINESFRRLRADPEAWADYMEEFRI